MDKAKSQTEGPSRRRSMLPQKTSIIPFSKPMASVPERDGHEAGGQCAVSAVPRYAQNTAGTMLPPSKLLPYASKRPPISLGPAGSTRDSAKICHPSRQPSASRKSSRDSTDSTANRVLPSQDLRNLSHRRPQVRTSSVGRDSLSNAKDSEHGRSLSQQLSSTATSELSSMKNIPPRQSSMKHSRPVFSAMQQRFSPKKNIQPDPSTLSSHSANGDEIPSADIIHLQMELAQLHLLHRSAFSVQIQWEKSAKQSFEYRFNGLHERHTELKEVAHQQQTLINHIALVQWSRGRSGAHIAEKVQLLSQNFSAVCILLDSEGKYTHILEIFESWFAQALRVRGQRESNGKTIGRDLDFIEGIGDGWKAEAMVLERELTYSARDLESFGKVQSASSLGRMLSLYGKLMVRLLEELDLIQWIENQIMTQETSWIESAIYKLASNVTEDIAPRGLDRKAV